MPVCFGVSIHLVLLALYSLVRLIKSNDFENKATWKIEATVSGIFTLTQCYLIIVRIGGVSELKLVSRALSFSYLLKRNTNLRKNLYFWRTV
jgi:hypothetical protein